MIDDWICPCEGVLDEWWVESLVGVGLNEKRREELGTAYVDNAFEKINCGRKEIGWAVVPYFLEAWLHSHFW